MSRFSRRAREPLRNHLLDQIDELALELRAAAPATSRGQVPLAARADYLRAEDAHRRAVLDATRALGRRGAHAGRRAHVSAARCAVDARWRSAGAAEPRSTPRRRGSSRAAERYTGSLPRRAPTK